MINLNNINKSYITGKYFVQILNNINMKIKQGDYIWLKGRSGSGKTTLMNIASGLDVPTEGYVMFNEIDMRRMSDREKANLRNEKIGYIFQTFKLLDGSVFKNVALPLTIRKVPRKEMKRKVFSILEIVGLKEQYAQNVKKLSGGEQQRVVFARALVKEPEIIFADEPFSNLDDMTAIPLIKLLSEQNEKGKTVFLVTHSYEDRIKTKKTIILESGNILEI